MTNRDLMTPPDLESFLTAYLRDLLDGQNPAVQVGNKEPSNYVAQAPLVVVRNDGGPKTSPLTWEWQVGISVLAGTPQDDKPANDLARFVYALATDPVIAEHPSSPVVMVVDSDCNGPYAVDDPQPVARRYMTVGYVVVADN